MNPPKLRGNRSNLKQSRRGPVASASAGASPRVYAEVQLVQIQRPLAEHPGALLTHRGQPAPAPGRTSDRAGARTPSLAAARARAWPAGIGFFPPRSLTARWSSPLCALSGHRSQIRAADGFRSAPGLSAFHPDESHVHVGPRRRPGANPHKREGATPFLPARACQLTTSGANSGIFLHTAPTPTISRTVPCATTSHTVQRSRAAGQQRRSLTVRRACASAIAASTLPTLGRFFRLQPLPCLVAQVLPVPCFLTRSDACKACGGRIAAGDGREFAMPRVLRGVSVLRWNGPDAKFETRT